MKKNYIVLLLLTQLSFLCSNGIIPLITPRASYFFPNNPNVLKLITSIRMKNNTHYERLLSEGVDLNFIGKDGITPLYYLFLKQDFKAFSKALELGANPNVYPIKSYSLINATIYIKDDRYFKELIKYKVNLNYRIKGTRSLIEGATFSTVDIKYLQLLLNNGIEILYSDFPSSNILSFAIAGREYQKVKLILEYHPELLDNLEISRYFIESLQSTVQGKNTRLLNDQQDLVSYLKEKFGIEVILKYPEGK